MGPGTWVCTPIALVRAVIITVWCKVVFEKFGCQLNLNCLWTFTFRNQRIGLIRNLDFKEDHWSPTKFCVYSYPRTTGEAFKKGDKLSSLCGSNWIILRRSKKSKNNLKIRQRFIAMRNHSSFGSFDSQLRKKEIKFKRKRKALTHKARSLNIHCGIITTSL